MKWRPVVAARVAVTNDTPMVLLADSAQAVADRAWPQPSLPPESHYGDRPATALLIGRIRSDVESNPLQLSVIRADVAGLQQDLKR